MNSHLQARPAKAFAGLDLMVLIALIAILAGILLPALAKAKARARRIACVNNLKQVGLGYRLFSNDRGDKFPMQLSTNKGGTLEFQGQAFRHFQALSNEVVLTKILTCPADTRVPAPDFRSLQNANISYFVALDAQETRPQLLLAGDRNLVIDGTPVYAIVRQPDQTGLTEITKENTVEWSREIHQSAGNVGLCDGSVQQMNSSFLQEHIRATAAPDGKPTRLVLP